MKKALFFLFALTVAVAVNAQNTAPRFQTQTYGRSVSYKLNDYKALTDTTGADTLSIYPKAGKTIIKLAVVDSIALKFASVKNSYVGDEVLIVATNASGASHLIKILSTNTVPASTGGTVTLASTLGAVIRYVFNGAKWVEASRAVQ